MTGRTVVREVLHPLVLVLVPMVSCLVAVGMVVTAPPSGAADPSSGAGLAPASVLYAPALTAEGGYTPASWVDVDGNGAKNAGDTVGWRVVITNTGNLGMTRVSLADVTLPLTCPTIVELGQGSVMTCTGTIEITDAMVAAGALTVTGNVVAVDVWTVQGYSTPITSTPLPLSAEALGFSVLSPTLIEKAGPVDVVLQVANLTDQPVAVQSVDAIAWTPVACVPQGGYPITLAPGATTTCTLAMAATDLDVTAQSLGFLVDASAFVGDQPVLVADFIQIRITPAVAELSGFTGPVPDSFVDVNGDGLANTGDTVRWYALVVNSGDATLHFTGLQTDLPLDCGLMPRTLESGDQLTCEGDVTITAAMTAAGQLAPEVIASGVPMVGVVPVSGSLELIPMPLQAAEPEVAVSVLVNGAASITVDAGSAFRVTYTVANIGNVRLDDLMLADAQGNKLDCTFDPLLPEGVAICTLEGTLTTPGLFTYAANVAATGPFAGEVTATGAAQVTVNAPVVVPPVVDPPVVVPPVVDPPAVKPNPTPTRALPQTGVDGLSGVPVALAALVTVGLAARRVRVR